jgi:hypothetical protein
MGCIVLSFPLALWVSSRQDYEFIQGAMLALAARLVQENSPCIRILMLIFGFSARGIACKAMLTGSNIVEKCSLETHLSYLT